MNDFIANNIITVWVTLFVFEVLMGILAQSIAEKKGHSKRWFWAGFLLSLVGVLWAAGLPDEHLRRELKSLGERREAIPAPVCAPSASPAQDDGELAAVIAAAVAAMGEEEGTGFVLRAFRPAGQSSTAWRRAGRN